MNFEELKCTIKEMHDLNLPISEIIKRRNAGIPWELYDERVFTKELAQKIIADAKEIHSLLQPIEALLKQYNEDMWQQYISGSMKKKDIKYIESLQKSLRRKFNSFGADILAEAGYLNQEIEYFRANLLIFLGYEVKYDIRDKLFENSVERGWVLFEKRGVFATYGLLPFRLKEGIVDLVSRSGDLYLNVNPLDIILCNQPNPRKALDLPNYMAYDDIIETCKSMDLEKLEEDPERTENIAFIMTCIPGLDPEDNDSPMLNYYAKKIKADRHARYRKLKDEVRFVKNLLVPVEKLLKDKESPLLEKYLAGKLTKKKLREIESAQKNLQENYDTWKHSLIDYDFLDERIVRAADQLLLTIECPPKYNIHDEHFKYGYLYSRGVMIGDEFYRSLPFRDCLDLVAPDGSLYLNVDPLDVVTGELTAEKIAMPFDSNDYVSACENIYQELEIIPYGEIDLVDLFDPYDTDYLESKRQRHATDIALCVLAHIPSFDLSDSIYDLVYRLNAVSKEDKEKGARGLACITNKDSSIILTEYKNREDVTLEYTDARFFNKETVKHLTFKEFMQRTLPDVKGLAKKYIGQIFYDVDGNKAVVIAYRGAYNVDVEFEDGTQIKDMTWQQLMAGSLSKSNESINRIGEKRMVPGKDGTYSWQSIEAYRNPFDIDIKSPTGYVHNGRTYNEFTKGVVSTHTDGSHVGQKGFANNGLSMEVIAYESRNDMTVKFEDGEIKEHVQLKEFNRGNIGHPKITARYGFKNFHGFTNGKPSFKLSNGQHFYEATSPSGKRGIWTPQQMIAIAKLPELVDETAD